MKIKEKKTVTTKSRITNLKLKFIVKMIDDIINKFYIEETDQQTFVLFWEFTWVLEFCNMVSNWT